MQKQISIYCILRYPLGSITSITSLNEFIKSHRVIKLQTPAETHENSRSVEHSSFRPFTFSAASFRVSLLSHAPAVYLRRFSVPNPIFAPFIMLHSPIRPSRLV